MNTAVKILGDFKAQLKKLDQADARARAERDFAYFCETFTAYSLRSFHETWLREIRNEQIALLLAPRGSSKSTTLTINRVAWLAIKNPDLRILIVSATGFMARRLMREIRSLLMSEPVRETWGDLKGDKWTDNEINLATRTRAHKEATITALGAGESIISGHYDLIVGDDMVNEEWCRSALLRDKIFDWLRFSLLPTLEPEGQLIILGTRYHWDDLYGRLIDLKKFRVSIKKIIAKAIQDDGSSFWPERFPIEALEKLRKMLGTIIFNAQYQNDATAMLGKIFKPDWIKRYKRLPDGVIKKAQGVDLAIGEKKTNDYFAHVTIGVDKQKNIYVLDAYRDRITFDAQHAAVERKYEEHHKTSRPVVCVAIESNAYQEALAQRIRMNTMVPVRSIHQTRDKVTRAQWFQPHMENGKVFFPYQGTDDLEMEILTFDEGAHDDLLDALILAAMAAGLIKKRGRARARSKPKGF